METKTISETENFRKQFKRETIKN